MSQARSEREIDEQHLQTSKTVCNLVIQLEMALGLYLGL